MVPGEIARLGIKNSKEEKEMAKITGNAKGFTLIELMVVIIIIGVLASISVPIYKNYISRARASEGRALCGAVAAAERVYFAEKGVYATDTPTLAVDASKNTYFQVYTPTLDGATGFTITTSGVAGGDAAGISITWKQPATGGPTVTEVLP